MPFKWETQKYSFRGQFSGNLTYGLYLVKDATEASDVINYIKSSACISDLGVTFFQNIDVFAILHEDSTVLSDFVVGYDKNSGLFTITSRNSGGSGSGTDPVDKAQILQNKTDISSINTKLNPASSTAEGVVSTSAQTFSGVKTIKDGLAFEGIKATSQPQISPSFGGTVGSADFSNLCVNNSGKVVDRTIDLGDKKKWSYTGRTYNGKPIYITTFAVDGVPDISTTTKIQLLPQKNVERIISFDVIAHRTDTVPGASGELYRICRPEYELCRKRVIMESSGSYHQIYIGSKPGDLPDQKYITDNIDPHWYIIPQDYTITIEAVLKP